VTHDLSGPAVSATGWEGTVKEKVEFDGHKTVKRPTEVGFTTKGGKSVDFVANKPTKIPVHVKFTAKKK
jgi:hypothetical protein